ncbi:MAG: hypothetical protein KC582_04460 [Candidatus Magasanikbacteria bacterium]|nr:hypothetical protein [Candidatus Magasanikbacteria bacterium]MCA9391480.1 hypothetical protein [Candidatus Magasanikbacteria bacterium]USN52800.1 MAG: hypothetical protein H6759_01900 [Candidatus Nomurabacteria bacterium]HPF94946.1 hypothetical protein [bacterium]
MSRSIQQIIAKISLFSLFLSVLPFFPVKAALQDVLIKSPNNSAVYYVLDGKRYVFPNERIYKSWYIDFSTVQLVTDGELASYQIGGNIAYRPGTQLVKIESDPKVYVVAKQGVLHWLGTEGVAQELYGDDWAKKVHDLADAFFVNYSVGEPVYSSSDYVLDDQLAVKTLYQWYKGIPNPEPPAPVTMSTMFKGCPVFPASNAWNQRVDGLTVHEKSATYINAIGSSASLHPDFGENQSYGIPYTTVDANTPKVAINYTAYGDESDAGPFPIPPNARVEGGSDRHVLVVDKDACMLYELYAAVKTTTGWNADSGAKWDLRTGALRPEGWTSADAAGLPIFNGLVRYDEIAAGKITHAIRVTVPRSQAGHILPATHHAGSNDANLPPMGLRLRLKKDYDISGLTGSAKIVAQAMKEYGLIVADNGSPWYFQGATDDRWNDDELNQLKNIKGSAFEAVYTGEIRK